MWNSTTASTGLSGFIIPWFSLDARKKRLLKPLTWKQHFHISAVVAEVRCPTKVECCFKANTCVVQIPSRPTMVHFSLVQKSTSQQVFSFIHMMSCPARWCACLQHDLCVLKRALVRHYVVLP